MTSKPCESKAFLCPRSLTKKLTFDRIRPHLLHLEKHNEKTADFAKKRRRSFIGPKDEEVNGVEMIVITFMKPFQVKIMPINLKNHRLAVVFVRKQHYFF